MSNNLRSLGKFKVGILLTAALAVAVIAHRVTSKEKTPAVAWSRDARNVLSDYYSFLTSYRESTHPVTDDIMTWYGVWPALSPDIGYAVEEDDYHVDSSCVPTNWARVGAGFINKEATTKASPVPEVAAWAFYPGRPNSSGVPRYVLLLRNNGEVRVWTNTRLERNWYVRFRMETQ